MIIKIMWRVDYLICCILNTNNAHKYNWSRLKRKILPWPIQTLSSKRRKKLRWELIYNNNNDFIYTILVEEKERRKITKYRKQNDCNMILNMQRVQRINLLMHWNLRALSLQRWCFRTFTCPVVLFLLYFHRFYTYSKIHCNVISLIWSLEL